jgi:VanZ family protein
VIVQPNIFSPTPAGPRVFCQSRWGWLLLGSYLLALAVSTQMPHDIHDDGSLVEYVDGDNTIHFLAYFGLATLLFLFCPVGKSRFTAFALAVGLVLFAAVVEIFQPSLGRTAELLDWLMDVAGIVFGVVVTRHTVVCRAACLDPSCAACSAKSRCSGSPRVSQFWLFPLCPNHL